MTANDGGLEGLYEALRLSPDNVPLRQHLAETLLGRGRPEEAEAEFRRALAQSSHSTALKMGLSKAFYQQGKLSEALVTIEDLIKDREPPAAAHVLYARLLFRQGEVQRAVSQYKLAIEIDPASADAEFGERLGVCAPSDSSEVVDGRVREAWEAPSPAAERRLERPQAGFESVGGMETLKEEIRLKIIYPLSHPEIYQAYGKAVGGGILMYGPPGCGKTHLARATAGEIKAGFLAIGINDVLDMWIGSSERNLHELFEHARQNVPCVLFFDEVDALGGRRSDAHHGSARQLINQFLAELDGVETTNEGVLILAATNAPWHLDPAFRRPGRFDRVLFVPPPDAEARSSILRILCRGKPVSEIDFDQLAKKTEHFSGADLKGVLDQAIEQKLRAAMKEGAPKPLTTGDLLAVVKGVKPTTREWFATAKNYALYSNQGGTYDDILRYMKLG